ncbi:hypothetical protein [Tropicimonas sp. IMCC6043]|uniref:hypothetical protein n=1 Tax=Tropicimonas sp. IMCC6043 TaxID=2510645 RepID=UPI00101C3B4A|nr:hypothetical protein [Tropicimonas sp. IMCC6043]RYH10681.1 hypothetical protein EU800_08065 [Tropicimonas sp. IMCC6043]
MSDVLRLEIPRCRSDSARRVLTRIAWRGYMPPESDGTPNVLWQVPADQVDLIRSVLRRNRRLAGDSVTVWGAVDRVCEMIAAESDRTGVRPCYHHTPPDTGAPD